MTDSGALTVSGRTRCVTPPMVSESIDRLSPDDTLRQLGDAGRSNEAAAFAATVPARLARFAALLADASVTLPRRIVPHLVRAVREAGAVPPTGAR